MTDKTKAISGGWIAPYYDEEGTRHIDSDVIIKPSIQEAYLPFCIVDNSTDNHCFITLAQAKALIDALQKAVAECEEREEQDD